MTAGQRTGLSVVAVVAGLALAVTGCGSAKKTTTSGGSKAKSGGSGTVVTVTEKDFSIDVSQSDFKPGSYTFKVSNRGPSSHNLTIDGPGVKDKASDTVAGGKSGEVTVTLTSGSYEMYCSVDGHKDNGMEKTIKVA